VFHFKKPFAGNSHNLVSHVKSITTQNSVRITKVFPWLGMWLECQAKLVIDGFFLSPLKLMWRMKALWIMLEVETWRQGA